MKTKNPTVLDYAILGLLRNESLSGYRIRKTFEETAMGNYSSSPGTIYPAISRLEGLALVEKSIDQQSGKALVRITPQGKSMLKAWLVKPIEYSDVERKKDELYLRFAFMDVVDDKETVIQFLESFRDLLINCISNLTDFHRSEGQQLPLFGRLAFEQGIESAKATLRWCKRAILEVSKNN